MQTTSPNASWTTPGNDLRPSGHGAGFANCAEGLGLTYTKLIAWPSICCCAMAVLLHQLTCQLASEPTHWGAAAFIGGLCFVMAIGLFAAQRRRPSAIVLGAAVGLISALGLVSWQHCGAHQLALYGLVAISVPLIASSIDDLRRQTHSKVASSKASLLSLGQHADEPSSNGLDKTDSSAAVEVISEALPVHSAQRPIWSRYAIAIVLSSFAFIYLVAVPTASVVYDLLWPSTAASRTLTDMSIPELIRLHTVSLLVMLIFLSAGASIGSFLNVLIFRSPRRRPLFLPSSACPNCETEIAGTDNIPVLSWLRLGGKCRNCDIAISARYPIIEFIVAMLFVVFYFRELLSGGANLPVRPANMYNGIVWILLYTKWDLVSLYFFHMFLLVCLLAWGMINYDRFRVPVRNALCAIAITMLLASVFPHLNPIASAWTPSVDVVPASMIVSMLGCLVGLVGSFLLWPLTHHFAARVGTAAVSDSSSIATAKTAASPLPAVVASELAMLGPAVDCDASISQGNSAPSGEAEGVESASPDNQHANELYGGIAREPNDHPNVEFSLALVGAALGYEAVVIVIVMTVVAWIASRCIAMATTWQPARRWPCTLWVFASTALLLLFWQDAYQLYAKCIYSTLGAL